MSGKIDFTDKKIVEILGDPELNQWERAKEIHKYLKSSGGEFIPVDEIDEILSRV